MADKPPEHDVVVRDVRMPFTSMVVFMVKWALAAIPAMLIFFTAFVLCGLLMIMLFGSLVAGIWGALSGSAREPAVRTEGLL